MQDFWKVAFSFGMPWGADLKVKEIEDADLEVEEMFDEEEEGLDLEELDPERRMEIMGFEL
jgi:hypothetical protein